ncbi:hypothetical protein [Simkania sp.]|uniref:hypothetical protein n=1 Tax=Simkania sp. TaxID=34094 RepID=UPI003B51B190
MAKPVTNTPAQKNSFTDYLPPAKELAIRTATYGATSLLLGRVNPVALTLSTLNAITVSFAEQFTQAEESDLKKVIISLASLAASTFVVTQVAPAIVEQATLAFTQDFGLQLAFLNALGEAVLFSIPYIANWDAPKLPESTTDLDKLTKKNLLHMRNHFGDFKAMTPDVFNIFVGKLEALEQENLVPKQPKTIEDIKNLDAFEVRYIYDLVMFVKDKTPELLNSVPFTEAYFTRFIEQGYLLPVHDFEIHTEKTLLLILDNFADYSPMARATFKSFVSKLEGLAKKDIFPKPPKTLDDIKKLDAFELHYARYYPTKMNTEIKKVDKQAPLWEALYLRFIEQKIPLPTSNLKRHTKETLLHMHDHFEDNKSINLGNFKNFVLHLKEHNISMPTPPKTIDEIQQLDSFGVRYAHTFPEEMNAEIMKTEEWQSLLEVLNTRFYEEDLPLPNEDTIQKIRENKSGYYAIKIDSLPTFEEVQAFSINKLSWLYCQIGGQFGVFATYSINDQMELNKIFKEKFESTWHYSPTMANIADLSDENAKELHAYFQRIQAKKEGHRFLCLPMDVKNALNERFTKLAEPLAPFGTTADIPELAKIKEQQASTWHNYLTNNFEEWAKVNKDRQVEFNNLFKANSLDEIVLTHTD